MPNPEHGAIDRQNDDRLTERAKCRTPGERTACHICPRFASGACGSLPIACREELANGGAPKELESYKVFAKTL